MKTIHFISGLPRSGSTLLSNILAQNPDFFTTGTSGILDILFTVRNTWDSLIENKAIPDELGKKRVLKGILQSYFETPHSVVFDKSRGWTAYIEMAEHILGRKVKILVPVRDVRDVLSSFEKLWREASKTGQVQQERDRYFDFQEIKSRTKIWLEKEQPVGLAYNRIEDAINRGFRDRLHFVRFEDLTTKPKLTMERIYEFLGEPSFEHDFENVEQVNTENDTIFGFKNLHKTRPKVEPIPPQWPTILGSWAEPYGNLNFW